MGQSKRLDLKSILIFLIFVFFICSFVDAMATTFAIRIPNKSPLGYTTTDDGHLLLLQLPESGSTFRLVVRKMDGSGNQVWETGLRIALQSGQKIISGSITRQNDGGFIVSVIRASYDLDLIYTEEVFFINLDGSGKILWQRRFGGDGSDAANLGSVISFSDGAFAAAGGSDVFDGTPGVVLASFNSTGTLRWGKRFSNFSPNLSQAMVVTANENLILVSEIRSPSGVLVFRVDKNGNLIWSRLIQGAGLHFVSASFVPVLGGCVLLFNQNASHHIYLIRLDPTGKLVWKKSFQASGAFDTRGLSITTRGSRFAIAGVSDNEGFIAILNRDGKMISSSHINGAIDTPGFIEEYGTGYAVLTKMNDSPGGSMLLQLNSNASMSCSLFETGRMNSLAPEAVSISDYALISRDWIPEEKSANLQPFRLTSQEDTTICSDSEYP